MWPFWWKGASGFSARSTAEEVTHGIDGTGLTAIVIGASSGIGEETTRVLALRGVHVIMAVRNTDSGNQVREKILKETPEAKIDEMKLDLSSMVSIRSFASEYKSLDLPLNLLINNAGIYDTMKKTANESNREGRIVVVSSKGHRFTYREGIRFDKINDEASYNTLQAYGQSKLCNILHATELARQFKEQGVNITANSLHPGSIMTNLLRYHSFINTIGSAVGKYVLKSIPQAKGVSGEYLMDNNISNPSSQGKDKDLAKKLWEFSLSLTGKEES